MRILALFEKPSGTKTTGRHWWKLLPKLSPLCQDSFPAESLSSDEYVQITYADVIAKGPKYHGSDLMAEYLPDVTIVYGKATDIASYLSTVRCPTVAIMTDSCYMFPNKTLMDEYVDCGVDIMFQRGTYDPDLSYPMPQVYWPFSANPEEFFPRGGARQNKIGFAGSLDNPVYDQRRIAGSALSRAGLLSVCRGCQKGADPYSVYPQFLRHHVAGLTSTQMDHIPSINVGDPRPADLPPTPRAKTFEMMASATAVLTPPFYAREALFQLQKVCFWYERDCSDVVRVASAMLNDPAMTREVALAGYNHFLQHHTDAIRIQELYDHLVRLVEGKPIERQWGI